MKIKFLIFTSILSIIALGTACSSATVKVNVAANQSVNTNANLEPAPEAASGVTGSETFAPEALVADLYKQHDNYTGPFFQTKSRALVDKYFTKPLADLIWKDATTSNGAVGAIEADPLYGAQDTEIKDLKVGRAAISGETATVPVTFENFEAKQKVAFTLKMVSSVWRIDDIKYPKGDSLTKWLKDTYPTDGATTSNGEFEGKYQVGDTTCTVKPVETAIEVRWAKGKGVEMFFSKDSTTFESSPGAGPANRFAFTDENHNSGMFYRADGATFAVKRAK